MDSFVDKLSQRLTAQEMIKANAAADAAELQKAKGQLAQYDALLKEIRENNAVNVQSAKQVSQLVEDALAKIEEIQAESKDNAELEEQLEALNASYLGLNAILGELNDHVHKENVKVYRNVQAVVVEETAKLNELETANSVVIKKISGKANAAVVIAIVTLIVTVASLALQILTYFNLI